MQNNVMKYIPKDTGMLNASRKVQAIAITVLFEIAYQNSNLGNLLTIGRNSSFCFVGNSSPCSSAKREIWAYVQCWQAIWDNYYLSRCKAGPILGVKKAITLTQRG